mmetsp:Transcript_74926/g.124441  ORF Transcript_74926/g.124441 Transcript_74926/m.124441 type:complete len:89 (-) Transcript_74926:364-630(-)
MCGRADTYKGRFDPEPKVAVRFASIPKSLSMPSSVPGAALLDAACGADVASVQVVSALSSHPEFGASDWSMWAPSDLVASRAGRRQGL